MTSKYEDALIDMRDRINYFAAKHNVPHDAPLWDNLNHEIEVLSEALRKAESMDRLIEASIEDNKYKDVYKPRVLPQMAANETAKYIEGN